MLSCFGALTKESIVSHLLSIINHQPSTSFSIDAECLEVQVSHFLRHTALLWLSFSLFPNRTSKSSISPYPLEVQVCLFSLLRKNGWFRHEDPFVEDA